VTSLLIRAAEPGDMPALSEVYRRSSLSNDGDRPGLLARPEFLEFSDLAVREGRTRVAIAGDRVAGFATWLAAADIVEVEDLFVDPDWMRRGIGTALVLDLIEIARDAGARRRLHRRPRGRHPARLRPPHAPRPDALTPAGQNGRRVSAGTPGMVSR
jgi:GNAT superfamily N-acetyltransferase